MNDRCDRCRFWRRLASVQGQCRRRAPPAVVTSTAGERFAVWPLTDEDDWCGEFQPPPVALKMEAK